jgi:hypothetical protein
MNCLRDKTKRKQKIPKKLQDKKKEIACLALVAKFVQLNASME